MRLPSFFSRGGSGRGSGGARVLRVLRRPPTLTTQASASSDHIRRKTERAKRREEAGSWKDPEALGQARPTPPLLRELYNLYRIGLARLFATQRPTRARVTPD